MRVIFILGTILVSIAFLYRLIVFFRFKNQLRKEKYTLIKLKGFKNITWIHLVGGIAAFIAGYIFYKVHHFDYVLIFWFVLGFVSIIHSLISPHDYILINEIGIKETFGSRQISWDNIKSVDFNKSNNQEFSIKTDKKTLIVDYGKQLYLDNFLDGVRLLKPDIYKKYFDNE